MMRSQTNLRVLHGPDRVSSADSKSDAGRSVAIIITDAEQTSWKQILSGAGFAVRIAPSVTPMAEHAPVDIYLVDTDATNGRGLELCRQLADEELGAVILAVGRLDLIERIVAIEIGADDALPDDLTPREKIARIRALLRSAASQTQDLQGAGLFSITGGG